MSPITDKLARLLSSGFTMTEAHRELFTQGHTYEEITAATEACYEQRRSDFKRRNPILNNRFTPLVLLALNILVFFVLLPGSTGAEYPVFFALIGSIITIVLAFWTFASLTPSFLESSPIGVFALSFLSLLAFAMLFLQKTSSFTTNTLRDNSETAMARVTDKTRIVGRRGHSVTSITVAFRTKDNSNREASIDVTEQEFGSIREGMELPVLYSTENPGIARIAYDQTLQYYGK